MIWLLWDAQLRPLQRFLKKPHKCKQVVSAAFVCVRKPVKRRSAAPQSATL